MAAHAPRDSPERLRSMLVRDPATSRRLGRVRQADTSPEQAVCRLLAQAGLRFRKRNRDLPGSPDAANRSRKWAVFVHGCFWHAHRGCPRATVPTRNRAFWEAKFAANRARDVRAVKSLRALGFRVIVVWECDALKRPRKIAAAIQKLRPGASGF